MFILPYPSPLLSKGTACILLRIQVLMSLFILLSSYFFFSFFFLIEEVGHMSRWWAWLPRHCREVVLTFPLFAPAAQGDIRGHLSKVGSHLATMLACKLFFFFFFFFFFFDVEELLCMDYGQSIYMDNFSALHYCKKNKTKKQTGVSTRYSYTNSFCICCSIPENFLFDSYYAF
ncbi:hypothetical protein AGOR_G00116480 [Albula goreensis]|uniref:Uncharacterized protein n=1 Tax=Albula goreensis TaxID=1534307 RepID=A0A8T3DFG0_9TELE|nr:hypothetical protein AGOR_G00116480 [Albula goreensis]